MKTLTALLLSILLPVLMLAQNGNIFAEVDSNNVTLWQTETWRNCGAEYIMHINCNDYQIDWFQEDIGQTAVCMCYFDLSVTFGSIESGTYNVNVYSIDSWYHDTIYEGTTQFFIENKYMLDSLEIISEFQSECYNTQDIANPEGIEAISLIIFPNPVKNVLNFYCNVNETSELFVYNSTGQIVIYIAEVEAGENNLIWNLESGNHHVGSGYYYVRLQTKSVSLVKKLVVF